MTRVAELSAAERKLAALMRDCQQLAANLKAAERENERLTARINDLLLDNNALRETVIQQTAALMQYSMAQAAGGERAVEAQP